MLGAMNHEPKVRAMERANVDRWFPRSPLGPMFDAGDGRMLPIPADAGGPWRDEAYARIDRYLVECRPPPQGAMVGIILVFTVLMLWLQPWLGFSGGQIGGIVMGGLALWHGHDVYQLWRYRKDLRELRQRIAASLALRTPLPAELGARFRLANPWRTALHVWVFGLIALAFGWMHFMDAERVSRAMVLLMLIGVGIAWLLYFAARRVDQSQQR